MWQKMRTFFKSKKTPSVEDTQGGILTEMQAIKKLARKQGALLEKMREELLEQRDLRLRLELDPLLAFADAFFHLDRFFHDNQEVSPQRQQALGILWEQLDILLGAAKIQMVRERGIPFDERLHEAVTNASPETLEPAVIDMIQPGYVCKGRVLRAARVIVGSPVDNNDREHKYESASGGATQDAETHMRY